MLLLSYETQFELWLGLDRIRKQWGFVIAAGVAAAMSDEPVDQSFFTAMSDGEDEAVAMERDTNRDRIMAAAIRMVTKQ